MKPSLMILLFFCSSLINANEIELFKSSANSYLEIKENTDIKFLGQLSNGYKIFNYFNVIGISHRGVSRVVAIDKNGVFIGMYPVNEGAKSVQESCILFPFPKDYGNTICLTEGLLPKEAWIDGELPILINKALNLRPQ